MNDDTFVIVENTPPVSVTIEGQDVVVIVKEVQAPTIVNIGEGAPSIDPNTFFQVLLYLAELDNETKKHSARTNLGLETIDGGVFT